MRTTALLLSMLLPSILDANDADVVDVSVRCNETCTFHVTVKHDDSGWDHYANQWDVLAPDGTVLGSRVLYHPHVDEQPFTRSLSGVRIPPDIGEVILRAHDSVHGYGGKEMTISLPPR